MLKKHKYKTYNFNFYEDDINAQGARRENQTENIFSYIKIIEIHTYISIDKIPLFMPNYVMNTDVYIYIINLIYNTKNIESITIFSYHKRTICIAFMWHMALYEIFGCI